MVGLNECFRLAKFYEGYQFGAHCDARFERNADEKSVYMVNVYTNTEAAENSGWTRFYKHADGALRCWGGHDLERTRSIDC